MVGRFTFTMKCRRFFCFLSLLLAPLGVQTSSLAAEQRPNVIFIVVDDLGYGELGCYGGKDIPTPHIDALAASGARFTSGYVTAPFCAASRAALMTGRLARPATIPRARVAETGQKRIRLVHCIFISCDWLRLRGPACAIPPTFAASQLSGGLTTVPDRPVYF